MASASSSSSGIATAEDFLRFVDASPSPFHATAECVRRLEAAGFSRLSEGKVSWKVERGGKYFFTRNQSTVAAFAVGQNVATVTTSGQRFVLLGAHTDSPSLRINPAVAGAAKKGYLELEISLYGGGLWHTWFDRDLGVAGRMIVASKTGTFESKLVRINRPVARVPTLAIHLTEAEERSAFKFNKETNFKPVFATELFSQLGKTSTAAGSQVSPRDKFMSALAKEAGCEVGDIRDFELCLCDTQPATIGGLDNEFVFAPRLDNLMMTYVSIQSLIAATANPSSLRDSSDVWGAACFDNEEVGSASAQGAGSPIMNELFERVVSALAGGVPVSPGAVSAAIRRSILVSADMAHAVHPNYSAAHQSEHEPKIHGGLVIKTNANQRYATTQTSAWLIREVARARGIKIQDFVVRNDMACGSTIGPIISENTGLRTVDVGIAQLSMHSIREQAGVADMETSAQLFKHFFTDFGKLDDSLNTKE